MTTSTTIQFYHLLSTSRERAVPKLMDKMLKSGQRAVLLMSSEAMLKTVSDALWANDPASFLPHGSARDGHASDQPIYLALTDENPNGADILCVLDGSSPASLTTYSKVLDVFDGTNDQETAAARTRWASYKAAGYTLQYIKQQPNGGWKVEMTSDASAA
jgi:DNA polymerase III subunit chi